MYNFILASLISLTFPFEIKLSGLSAGPLTIFLIYGLYASMLILTMLKDKTIWLTKFELTMMAFLMISCVFTMLGGSETLNSIRFFYIYGSGFVLLALLKRVSLYVDDQYEYRDNLVKCLFFICIFNIVIGTFMFKSPVFGGAYLSLMNISDYYELRSSEGTYFRMGTPITGPEATAEMVVFLAPLLLYYTVVRKQYLFGVLLIIAIQALLQTATRSGVILTGLSLILLVAIYNYYLRDIQAKLILILLPMVLTAIIILNPEMIQTLLYRFIEVSTGSSAPLSEQLNRGFVWENAFNALHDNVFIGHGFTRYTEGDYANFHSLYLTTLFQFGWFLGGLILIFLIRIPYLLLRACFSLRGITSEKLFLISLLFSLCAFLINEVKYEFTRFPSYMLTVLIFIYICMYSAKVNRCPNQ